MSATFLVDFKNATVGGCAYLPQVATADGNGTAVDFLTGDGPIFAVVNVGALDLASTDETYSVIIEESSVSNFASDVVTLATVAVTAANTRQVVNINTRARRYVRGRLDVGGTTPSIAFSVDVFSRKKITGSGGGYQA